MAELETVETKEEASEALETVKKDNEKKSKNKDNKKKKANTVKNNSKEEKSRILEYLKSEHKWENYLLLVLSLFALVLGCLIINGTVEVNESFPLIGGFPKVFAWILVSLSAFALILSLWPFFKPAFPEFKKITWMRPKAFFGNVARVFIFLIVFVLLFLLYNAFISKLIGWLLRL